MFIVFGCFDIALFIVYLVFCLVCVLMVGLVHCSIACWCLCGAWILLFAVIDSCCCMAVAFWLLGCWFVWFGLFVAWGRLRLVFALFVVDLLLWLAWLIVLYIAIVV